MERSKLVGFAFAVTLAAGCASEKLETGASQDSRITTVDNTTIQRSVADAVSGQEVALLSKIVFAHDDSGWAAPGVWVRLPSELAVPTVGSFSYFNCDLATSAVNETTRTVSLEAGETYPVSGLTDFDVETGVVVGPQTQQIKVTYVTFKLVVSKDFTMSCTLKSAGITDLFSSTAMELRPAT